VEVVGREVSLAEEIEDRAVNNRSDRLHQIGRERVAIVLIGVVHAEPRVEPDDPGCNRGLRLEDRVDVGEDRVDRVRRAPGRPGQRGGSGADRQPVRRDALGVAPRGSDRRARQGRPVDRRSHRLGRSNIVVGRCDMESGHRLADRRERRLGDLGRRDCRKGLGLGGDVLANEPSGEVHPDRRVEGPRLRPPESGSVGALWAERGEDAPVGVDLEEAAADVGQPADRIERDRPGVAQHDEPAEPAGRPARC
jgi:hypothetical protein